MKKYVILTGMILIIIFLKCYLAPITLNELISADIDLSKVEDIDVDVVITMFLPAENIEITNKDRINKLVEKIGSLRVRRIISPIKSLTFKPDEDGSYYIFLFTQKSHININIMDKDYVIIRNDNHNNVYKIVGENNIEEIYNLIVK